MEGTPVVGVAPGVPEPTHRKPSPWIATSSVLPVFCSEPALMMLSIEPTSTPRPICCGLVPAVGARLRRSRR